MVKETLILAMRVAREDDWDRVDGAKHWPWTCSVCSCVIWAVWGLRLLRTWGLQRSGLLCINSDKVTRQEQLGWSNPHKSTLEKKYLLGFLATHLLHRGSENKTSRGAPRIDFGSFVISIELYLLSESLALLKPLSLWMTLLGMGLILQCSLDGCLCVSVCLICCPCGNQLDI